MRSLQAKKHIFLQKSMLFCKKTCFLRYRKHVFYDSEISFLRHLRKHVFVPRKHVFAAGKHVFVVGKHVFLHIPGKHDFAQKICFLQEENMILWLKCMLSWKTQTSWFSAAENMFLQAKKHVFDDIKENTLLVRLGKMQRLSTLCQRHRFWGILGLG